MTNSSRDARICLTLALLSAATGIYFAARASWWCVPGFYCAVLLAWCERHLRADHRRRLRQQDRKPPPVPGGPRRPFIPCCRLALHSDGAAHDRWCRGASRGAPDGPRSDT